MVWAQIWHAGRPSPKMFKKFGSKLKTSSWVASLVKFMFC